MKKLCLGIILVVFCIVVSNIVITPPVKADVPALTLTYGEEQKSYTLDDLLAFDSITGNGGRLKVTGTVIPPNEYTGVLITTLAQEFTDIPSQYSVTAIASDGYIMNYTYNETKGEVMVYDNQGNEIGVGGVSMVLATKENGQIGYDGSLRIVFINQDEPITFSALWAKYVVELKFIPPPTIAISGPTSGKTGVEYGYTFVDTDPNGHDFYLWIEWGDDTIEQNGWIGPYASGEELKINHIWSDKGTYSIKAKAKDNISGLESDWTTLIVTMPCSYKPIPQLFERLFQRFPHAFPLLRQLMEY
jgi:hypothetical protein